jgi:hypothetical protein
LIQQNRERLKRGFIAPKTSGDYLAGAAILNSVVNRIFHLERQNLPATLSFKNGILNKNQLMNYSFGILS